MSLLLQEAAAATVASCCFCYSKGKPSWVEFEDPAEEEVEWVRLLLSQVAAELIAKPLDLKRCGAKELSMRRSIQLGTNCGAPKV